MIVLKTVSPNCGVWASLMLFYLNTVLTLCIQHLNCRHMKFKENIKYCEQTLNLKKLQTFIPYVTAFAVFWRNVLEQNCYVLLVFLSVSGLIKVRIY